MVRPAAGAGSSATTTIARSAARPTEVLQGPQLLVTVVAGQRGYGRDLLAGGRHLPERSVSSELAGSGIAANMGCSCGRKRR